MSKLANVCRYGQQMLSMKCSKLSSSSRHVLSSRFVIESTGTSASIATHNTFPVAVCTKVNFFSKTPSNRIVQGIDPDSDDDEYYDDNDKQHSLSDQLEYIDNIMDKAVEIEESITKLQKLYKKKKAVVVTTMNNEEQVMDSNDIEELFQESQQQKKRIRELVVNVKELSNEIKGRLNHTSSASDATVQKDSIIQDAWEQKKRDEQAIKIKANCDSHR